jgi:very-short-patch-repair endonuclease
MRGKDLYRTKHTGGQMKLEEILRKMGFFPELEVEFPPYTADIYLRKEHVIIEFDGAHSFHKRDARRDAYFIQNYKIPTLRVKDFNNGIEEKIMNFVLQWVGNSEERKQ